MFIQTLVAFNNVCNKVFIIATRYRDYNLVLIANSFQILKAPDNPQQTRLPPPNKPKTDAMGNEDEQEVAERATKEEDMQTIEGGEISTERLQSTFHSSEVALAFERLVR